MGIATLRQDPGATLASGEVCGQGTIMGRDSSGNAVVADASSGEDWVRAEGFALTTGAGTKTQGLPQRVRLVRKDSKLHNLTGLTSPNPVWLSTTPGAYTTSRPVGTKAAPVWVQEVGYAIDTNTIVIDVREGFWTDGQFISPA